MNWIFLDVAGIKRVQTDLIDVYGGSHGIRDEGLLASAVGRAEMKVTFDPEATVSSVAASLSYGLIKNHAFIDGNKRIGLATLVNFLALNGYRVTASQEEQVSAILKVATSEFTESDWASWVKQNSTPEDNKAR